MEFIFGLVQLAWLFEQLLSLTMAGEQTETVGEREERLRLAALASQSERPAANDCAPAPGGDQSIPGMPPGFNQASLQAMPAAGRCERHHGYSV